MWGDADTTPLYKKGLSICGFWYLWGSWNQGDTEVGRRMCECVCVQIYVQPLRK
jgi:hypothetical protein